MLDAIVLENKKILMLFESQIEFDQYIVKIPVNSVIYIAQDAYLFLLVESKYENFLKKKKILIEVLEKWKCHEDFISYVIHYILVKYPNRYCDKSLILPLVPHDQNSFYISEMINFSKELGNSHIPALKESCSPLIVESYLIEACVQTFLASQVLDLAYAGIFIDPGKFFLASIDDVILSPDFEISCSSSITCTTVKINQIENFLVFEGQVYLNENIILTMRAKCIYLND